MTAAEIAARLANCVDSVCTHLLPNGVKDGHEWCVGSISGEAGKSLKVHLTGPKAGIWRDFAADHGGDLLDLWAQCHGQSIPEAMKDAADWLGVPMLKTERIQPVATVKLPAPDRARRVGDGPVMRWLKETRKLPEDSIRAYRLAERDGEVVLPAFSPEGALQFVKYRATDAKRFHSEKGGLSCLFGWQAIPADARQVVICEGELDAVAWHAYGIPALSPTNGAQSLNWIDTEYDHLARFDVIYLAYDMDQAGQQGAASLVDRLGRERCRLVKTPRKDANECLMADVPRATMRQAIDSAESLDPDELVRVSAYRDVVQSYFAGGAQKTGVRLPWEKAADRFVFGPGELTILAGQTGHGKTEVANQITLSAMQQGMKACVASMEFTVDRWLPRISRQAAGLKNPSPQYLDAVLDWLDDRLVLYGRRGTSKVQNILDVFRYAARRYGVRWFVVDNLAKCGIAEDDYNGQKAFIDMLGDFANDQRSHVILCAHMRKSDSDQKTTSRMDVKGTGAISDMADNVAIHRRNKRKEKAQKAGVTDFDNEPDAWFSFDKVRDGDDEPLIKLWWHEESHQYVEFPSSNARRYVSWTKANIA